MITKYIRNLKLLKDINATIKYLFMHGVAKKVNPILTSCGSETSYKSFEAYV